MMAVILAGGKGARLKPFTVPRCTRRYFITLPESAHICLLASICAPHRHLLIPRLDAANDLRDLQSLAEAVLRYHEFEPRVYEDEMEARTRVQSDLEKGRYPLLVTELNTDGEKPYEEFVGEGETTNRGRYA